MKLLIVSDAWHPQVNGVVRTYEHLKEELEKKGHTVHVVGPKDFRVSLPMPMYPEIRLALAPYGRLKKLIEEFEPEHIHIATEGPLGWAARRYCMLVDYAFTTSYHTHFPDYTVKRLPRFMKGLSGIVRTLAIKFVRHFHAPAKSMLIATKSLEKELKDWGFTTAMRPLTRGVNLDQFYPGDKTLFQDLPKPVALYVGRVAVEKSIEDFLKMDWDGSKVIVGDGPSREELAKAYPDAHFVGKKTGEDLAAHYRSADLFVFPSRTDTFGIVLIEALASGLPVAGYTVTGPIDIITEPFLGHLDDTDLAKAARVALKNGTAQERADYVKDFYRWEKAAQQFENAITE